MQNTYFSPNHTDAEHMLHSASTCSIGLAECAASRASARGGQRAWGQRQPTVSVVVAAHKRAHTAATDGERTRGSSSASECGGGGGRA